MLSKAKFALVLFALSLLLKFVAWRYPHFAAQLKERNLVAQIKARDEGIGRWIAIRDGRVTSGAGLHAMPDITLLFKNAAIGASLLTPPINWLNQINAQKDFVLGVDGPEDLTNWFAQSLIAMQNADFKFDRLDENSGDYVVEIAAAGRPIKNVTATLGASASLGGIRV